MPLQGVDYRVVVNNSIVKTTLNLQYLNDQDKKIEAVLEMPTNTEVVIAQLKVKIGDKEVIAVVKEKSKAKE